MTVLLCLQVDPKGGTVVVGFHDGVVRILGVSKLLDERSRKKKHHECSLQLLQAFKPHSQAVTSVAIDIKGEVLATGVSGIYVLCNKNFLSVHLVIFRWVKNLNPAISHKHIS